MWSHAEQLRGLCRACGLPPERLTAGVVQTVHAALRKLWGEAGDVISMQYTGTANLTKGSHLTSDAPRKSLVERASGLVEKVRWSGSRQPHYESH